MERKFLQADAAMDALRAHGTLKVWSVLVTILGDYAPTPGASLTGTALAALTARIGIRPEALRVALHRLRKDGWITSRRVGRISHYALSPRGRAETLQAHQRIYAARIEPLGDWFVAILQPDGAPPAERVAAIELSRGIYLTRAPDRFPAGTLLASMRPGALPGWLRDQVLPGGLDTAYGDYLALLTAGFPDPAFFDPIDRAALRILVLHNWRRLVLRHPVEVASLLGDDWNGARCRARVIACLDMLPRQEFLDHAVRATV